jgi:outer membrane immunogenic protein
MKKMQWLILVIVLTAFSSNGMADTDTGIYLGGSVGNTNGRGSSSFDLDQSDTSYKIIAGYKFDLSSSWDIAIEASYRDFGVFENRERQYESDETSLDLTALVGYSWGEFGLFGKAGRSQLKRDVRIRESRNPDDTINLYILGIGADYDFNKLSIRAEYELFNDVLYGFDDSTSMFSIGATYSF